MADLLDQLADVPDPRDLAQIRVLAASGLARTIRINAAVSLREIAADIGVAPTSVQRWETAQRAPRGLPAVRYLRVMESLVARP